MGGGVLGRNNKGEGEGKYYEGIRLKGCGL